MHWQTKKFTFVDVLYNFKRFKNIFICFLHIFHLIAENYLKSLMKKSFVFAEFVDLFNALVCNF